MLFERFQHERDETGFVLAERLDTGQAVAVWRLPERVDADLEQRLRDLSALALPGLLEPSEVGVAGAGDDAFGLGQGQPYVIVSAADLSESAGWDQAGPTLSAEQRLAVAVQATWTLRDVHEAGLCLGEVEAHALRVDRRADTAHAVWAAPGGLAVDAVSDLAALGRCLQVGLPDPVTERSDQQLATLASRLQDPDPEQRPSATEVLQRLLESAPGASAVGEVLPRDPPLVGREALVEELVEVARERVAGQPDAPAWVRVEGEPGSGVRRVLTEVARRLALEGHPTRTEAEEDATSGLTWIPALEALDADAIDRLARLVRRSALEERPHLFAFGSLSSVTLEALEAVGAVAPPLRFALLPLERSDLVRLLEAILGRPPDPALVQVVERWSGGNPGRVRAALEQLRVEGALRPGADGWRLEVERLADLPAALPDDAAVFPPDVTRDERKLLRALSVTQRGMPQAALEQVAGLGPGPLEDATSRLADLGLLVRAGDRVRFARARARLRVLGSLRARDASTARRAHLLWLEQQPRDDDVVSDLADHAIALGDAKRAQRDVPEASERDEQAGRRLAALERRLAWRPLLGSLPAGERVVAWRALGDGLLSAGRVAAADEAFGHALATRSPDVGAVERAGLHRSRATCALRRGDVVSAEDALARARRALDQDSNDDPDAVEGRELERTRVLGLEVQVALKGGDRARVLELTASAETSDVDDRARGSLLNLRGLAHFHRGEPTEARGCFDRSLAICQRLALPAGVAAVLGNLALVEDYEGHPDRAGALHQRSLDVALDVGSLGQVATAASNLGNLANRAGRLKRAREHYRESLGLAAERGDDEAVCIALCALADTFLAEGDARQALSYVERAGALARVIGVPYAEALALVNAADALACLGRLDAARAAVDAAVALREGLNEPARLARALTLSARIEALCGEGERAAERCRAAQAALGDDPHPVARAEVALADLTDREAALAQAEAGFASAHDRLGLIRVALARARHAAAQGQEEGALVGARRAQAEAESLGARALAAEAALIALAAAPSADERALDRARGIRSYAHRFELPELAREAAGALALLHDARGEALEAGASRLDARRVVDAQCAELPASIVRTLRARPDVQRDVSAPEVEEPPKQVALAAPPTPAAPTTPRLSDVLAATAMLLRAERCVLVRTGEGEPELVAAHGAGDSLTDAERAALEGRALPGMLVAVVPGRPAVLVATREAPFGLAEEQTAAGLVAALSEHIDETGGGSFQSLRPTTAYGLLGRSAAMREVVRHIERFAPYALPVLIQGESGTGKELAARALHDASPRREGPFVPINASGFSPELVASELFGSVQGAFTGALEDRPGIFELAHTGTLLLDEIADAPPNVQAMLLRVLEEGQVRRVGGQTAIPVDVRVVCASLRDLPSEVRAGRFRQDLYYRLCGLELRLPSLRERPEDIDLLAQHVLDQAASEGRRRAQVGASALARLRAHDWPGNVRELRNTIERALALGSGPVIEVADLGLPAEARPTSTPGSLSGLERDAIARALADYPTLTAAARALGIHRRTLRRRMERYDLTA